MNSHPQLRFAVIGIDHRHIYDQVASLLAIGAQCVGYWTHDEVRTLDGFVKRFPQIARVADRRQLLDDQSVQLVVSAAIPCQRAEVAIEAMRHGKDVMVDKPGMTTLAQLDEGYGPEPRRDPVDLTLLISGIGYPGVMTAGSRDGLCMCGQGRKAGHETRREDCESWGHISLPKG